LLLFLDFVQVSGNNRHKVEQRKDLFYIDNEKFKEWFRLSKCHEKDVELKTQISNFGTELLGLSNCQWQKSPQLLL